MNIQEEQKKQLEAQHRQAILKQEEMANLASAFIKDHPSSGITNPEDLYKFSQTNPGIIEAWLNNQSGVINRDISTLAQSFNAATQLDNMRNEIIYAPAENVKGLEAKDLGLLLSPLAKDRTNYEKFAQEALTQNSPEVSLNEFIPSEITANDGYKNELTKLEQEKINEFKNKNPSKKYSDDEIKKILNDNRDAIRLEALNNFANTSEKAEMVNSARENDLYVKNESGSITGQRVFTDEKGNPDMSLDPVYQSYQKQKKEAIKKALLKNKQDRENGIKPKFSDIDTERIIEMQYDGHFAAMFPDKASAYSKKNKVLKFRLDTLSKAQEKLDSSKSSASPIRKSVNAYKKLYSYTPLGLLWSKVPQNYKDKASIKLTKSNANSAKDKVLSGYKKLYSYTPLGLLWKKTPEETRENIKNKTKSLKKISSLPSFDTKKGLKNAFQQGKSLYSYTPLGLLWGKVPQKYKDKISPGSIKKINPSSKIKLNTKKITSAGNAALGKTYSYTPLGLGYGTLPGGLKNKLKPEGFIKSAKNYQKLWNKNTLAKAVKKGYNRFSVLEKIRNSKIWKTRAWKYGKYALSPLGAAAYDRHKYLQRNKLNSNNKFAQILQGKNPYSQWTSPRSLSSKAWKKYASPKLSSLNKKLGRKIGNQALKKASSQLTNTIAKQGVKTAARFLLLNPVSLTIIGIVFLIIIGGTTFIIIISGQTGNDNDFLGGDTPGGVVAPPSTNPIPGLTLKLSGPTKILNSEIATYTVSISYNSQTLPAPVENINIYLDTPQNSSFYASSTAHETQGNKIIWSLANESNRTSFTFSLKPTFEDVFLNVFVYAELNATQANSDNCNGFYLLDNPVGNYGDPDCYFANNNAQAKSDLFTLLKSIDPENAEGWYLKVIPCESGYNPNAYLAASASGLGAYGLYQMNPSGKGNGEFDSGDVPWRQQTNNAVTYGKMITQNALPLGAYWHCWQ